MKIGILTLPLHTNYGGILQAYALQTVLERMGHEVEVITKERKNLRIPLWKIPLTYGKRIFNNLRNSNKIPVFLEQKTNHDWPIVTQYTAKFINQYIHQHHCNDYSNLQKDCFDAIIVGSDQVWRPTYYGKKNNMKIAHAFLDFTRDWNIKRIAYAVSFGTDKKEYTKEQIAVCKPLIQMFDSVSVRENSGISLCQEYFGMKAVHVLDPTMLLKKEDYCALVEGINTSKSKGNLMVSILDSSQRKTEFINQIAQQNGLVPFVINSKVDDISAPCKERIQPAVEQWLQGFMDAELVVTDSFHSCVFSIIFNKPFIVFGNKRRGITRMLSLLKMFGLESVLVSEDLKNAEQLNVQNYDYNWTNVNQQLLQLSNASKSLLKQI